MKSVRISEKTTEWKGNIKHWDSIQTGKDLGKITLHRKEPTGHKDQRGKIAFTDRIFFSSQG